MPVEIKITGETPLEALTSLTAFGLYCASDKDVCAAARQIMGTERVKETQGAAKMAKSDPAKKTTALSNLKGDATNPQAPADLPPEPYIEESPHGEPELEPGAPDLGPVMPEPASKADKPPKLEDVRAKGIEAVKKYGQPAVKALLEEFGAASMTALAEGDRAAFLEKLKGLGESNA